MEQENVTTINTRSPLGVHFILIISLQLEVRPNVALMFVNNTAEETGGAIHVTFPAIRYTTDIFNRLCFIQYNNPTGRDLPPHRWQVCIIISMIVY